MSDVKISALPIVSTITVSDSLPIVSSGTTSKVTPQVVVNTVMSTGVTVPSWITTTSTLPGLKITQAGTGNALLVQDAVSDTSPFVVDGSGKVGVGLTTPASSLQILVPSTGTSTQHGLHITQLGAGHALLVEDSTNPDSTPFVVKTDGTVCIGTLTSSGSYKLQVNTDILVNAVRVGCGTSASTNLNTILGYNSLGAVTTGYNNTAIGANTLPANTTGHDNTAIGVNTLYFSGIANVGNTAIGSGCLRTVSGDSNIAVGTDSLYSTSGSFNIGIGIGAGSQTGLSGSSNIFLGYAAGASVTTGSNNVIIGGNDGSTIATASNNIILSDGAGNARATYLNASTSWKFSGNVAIGSAITTPAAALHIALPATATIAGLKLTQGGSGNALYVEDTVTTDTSPFVINNGGYVGIGLITPTSPLHIVSVASVPAVKITHTGTGDTLLVEDNTSPDSSPFVINNIGNVGIGLTTPTASLHVVGAVKIDTTTNSQSYTTTGTGVITITSGSTGTITNMNIGDAFNGYGTGTFSTGLFTGTLTATSGAEIRSSQTDQSLLLSNSSTGLALYVNGSIGVKQNAATGITTTTYTVATSDTVLTFAPTATCTVTLGTPKAGRILWIRNITAFALTSASSNVYPRASATLGTAIAPATAGSTVMLVGDGTNWITMNSNF